MEKRKKTGLWVVVVVVLLAGAGGVWLLTSGPEVSEEAAVPEPKTEEVARVTPTPREKLPKPGVDGEKEQEDKSEEEEKEEEAAKIDVELVKTITLPEGTKDVMLDPETLEPKVLIGDTYVRFVDEDMNVKNSVVMQDNNRFYLSGSEQGKYLSIYIGKFIPGSRRFLFMDINGNLIWEGKNTCSVDEGLAECDVSDDGKTAAYAGTIIERGLLSFHRSNWSKELYPLDYRAESGGIFSPDGNYYGYVADEWAVLYDINGNELWRSSLNGELFGKMLLSENAQHMIVSSIEMSYCLDKNGSVMWSLERHYVNNNDQDGKADYISDDLNMLLLRKLGLRDISMIDLADGSILWHKNSKDLIDNYEHLSENELSRITIRNADVSRDWSLIAIASWNWDGVSPALDAFPRFLNLFDREGNLLWRDSFNSNFKPFLSKNGSLLAIDSKDSINYYQIR